MTVDRVSPRTYKLLLEFEVGGGEPYYNKKLIRPTLPGLQSGITIGIGYDLGYHAADEIRSDWFRAGMHPLAVDRLVSCAGKTKAAAKSHLPKVSDIVIPWPHAWWVFNERTLPKYIRATRKAFPGASEKLSSNAFGALVSLVFNRGGGMAGNTRRHMRAIRDLIATDAPDLHRIANEIRAMVVIWAGSDFYNGMKRRREAEASLVEA